MKLAERLRVSPSRLRGRRQVTRHHHDEHGRLVESVTSSEWTAEDRALLLALRSYESTLCSGCGHPKGHAWHPDNEGWFDTASYVCHACTAAKEASAASRGSKETVPPVEYVATDFTRDLQTNPYPSDDEMDGGAP